jgi:DNA-binding response OmpR family regulator
MDHVLIIEDDQVIAMLVRDVLNDEGVTSICVATNEADAVASGLAIPPSLIVSDVILKSGNGPSAVAAIREAVGPMPVIFTTGDVRENVVLISPGSILEKPFTCSQLVKAYRELCAPVARIA